MDQSERKKVLKVIESEMEKTLKNIADYKEMTKAVSPDNAIGRLSRMDAINNQGVMKAALEKAKEKLKSLEFLVNKVNEKDFGKCRRCGNEIPIQRMMFMPQSPFCVNCAS